MSQDTKLIPLEAIGDHFPLTIHAYPPKRQQLQVNLHRFSSAWKAANPSSSKANLAFIRDVPQDEPAPSGPGSITSAVMARFAQPEEERPPATVVYSAPIDTFQVKIPYRDEDVATVAGTAQYTSQALHRTFRQFPREKYTGLAKFDPAVQLENTIIAMQGLFDIAAPAALTLLWHMQYPTTAISPEVQAITLGGGAVAIHLAFTLANLMSLRNQTPQNWYYEFLADNPRRTLYPPTLVETWLVPAAHYFLSQALLEPPLILPTKQ